MNPIITKQPIDQLGRAQTFTFTYPKTVQDINGKVFILIDHIEELSLDLLNQQLKDAQAIVDGIQAKIDTIDALPQPLPPTQLPVV
jgi:hypothetical protein